MRRGLLFEMKDAVCEIENNVTDECKSVLSKTKSNPAMVQVIKEKVRLEFTELGTYRQKAEDTECNLIVFDCISNKISYLCRWME